MADSDVISGESSLAAASGHDFRDHRTHRRAWGDRDGPCALRNVLLSSLLQGRAPNESLAGDGGPSAGVWSAIDGGAHLRAASLSAQGAALSRAPSLVRADGHPADAASGVSLYFYAGIQRQRPPHPRPLAAGVGPLRSRRRESAHRPIEQVRNLGTSGGRRSSVLDPSRAVAYFGVRVLCRYYPGHVTVVQPLMRDRTKKSPHPRPLALVAL